MTQISIPCDTIARLAPIASACPSEDPFMRSVRLDDGIVVVNNEVLIVAEHIGGFKGVNHLTIPQSLIDQCALEAQFHSALIITVIGDLAVAKTTFGYSHNDNLMTPPTGKTTKFDKWRTIVKRAGEGLEKPGDIGMFWKLEHLQQLVKASPSGTVVFETYIDAGVKPVLCRDVYDNNWLGVSKPISLDTNIEVVKLPSWMD